MMLRLLLVALCLLGNTSLIAAEVYRSVDADGNISFTDQPANNAEIVDIDPLSNRYRHQVDYVYDGDTLVLENGERVRLLNINAPEISSRHRDSEQGGEAAKTWLKQQIGNQAIYLRFDKEKRDRYDRMLAHIFLDNERHLNAEMLRQGLAALTVHPPNLLYVDEMQAAQQQAIDKQVGIWDGQAYPLQAAQAGLDTSARRGWRRWQITPTEIKATRSQIWLMAGERLSLRIRKQQLPLFADPQRYLNKPLEVRGWLSRRGNDYFLQVLHPSAISVR
ncbi:MAG: thermonuclease family protein [Methylophaga sp.]|nr:thermonuclease family protein [Methylophaga sp.]